MDATIIPFPSRANKAQRLAVVAEHLQSAMTLPTSADVKLDILLRSGCELLGGVNDEALDRWLAMVADWEDKSLTKSQSIHERSVVRLHKSAFPA